MRFILESHGLVEKTYDLEKQGAFQPGNAQFQQGANFVKQRLARGSALLTALWVSAQRDAGIDTYRERAFQRKKPR